MRGSKIEKKKNFFNGRLKKYTFHTFWMVLEKVIRLTINLFVGVWLARYLGPSDFGVLNFGIAITTIFLPLVNFGLQGILVKELFINFKIKNKILGTAFFLKLGISLIVVFGIWVSGFFDIYSDDVEKKVVLFIALSLFFQPFLVIDSWYESQANAKKASIFKSLFFVAISIVKVIFILKEYSIVSFAIIYGVEAAFIAIALSITYLRSEGSLLHWRFDFDILKSLTKKSWLLVFSSFSAVIYVKIDQIMIASMISEEELGFYSAAVRLSEAWYFIPLIISNALFPAILGAKQKGNNKYFFMLQQLSDGFFLISFLLAIVVTFMANYIIITLFGKEYNSSVIILQIHIWAAIFVFLRTVLSKWLISEDKYRFSLISQLSGALTNVLLNYILIPLYGGVGAAIATIISYSVTSFFVLGLFRQTRPMFLIFVKSFIAPIRLLYNYENFFKKN
ncbi:flippase [Aquimarina sp. RZ0]|uniref:flippase n=1 Tax=Aquimarina sp. RZ0 TaxID=2607730 RepID=UPI0011F0F646|nr:flippase [Aquimarina sp. RZ0]KAA1244323.1 flippase [Aquimarina sp. RZ0]